MMDAARSMCGWTAPSPARLPMERTPRWAVRRSSRCPSWRQDRALVPFADGEVDRARRLGDERDGGRLVPLAQDLKDAVTAINPEVVDVRGACFAHLQTVQAE